MARNQLAVWLAGRQQIHLSLAGRSSLARAFGLVPEPSPSLAPLRSRMFRVRRRRRFLPARMTADVSLPMPQPAPEIGTFDIVDEETVFDEVVNAPPTLPEDTEAPLADLPGLQVLMRSVRSQPAQTSPRPRSSPENPARPGRPLPADVAPVHPSPVDSAPAGKIVEEDAPGTPGPPAEAGADVFLPDEQPEGVVPGSTQPVPEPPLPTPPLPKAPGADTIPDERQEEPLASEPADVPPETLETPPESAIPPSIAAPEQQEETPAFSPQYWLKRLEQVERRERETAGPRRVSTDEPVHRERLVPEPLPASRVRFLRPLVGVDPETVTVYRETPDQQMVTRAGADAMAVDDEILLALDQRIDTPEGAGLLAHELTHVARRRSPRFLPPVTDSVPDISGSDEEQIARQVESRVRQVARAGSSGRRTPPHAQPVTEPPVSLTAALPESQPVQPPAPPVVVEDVAAFGGLPAPWEPLPDLVVRPGAPAGMSAGDSIWHHEINVPLERSAGPMAQVVHHAESGRTVEETPPPERPSAPQPAVEPDLDALARQVYAVLRRRLLAEQRRAG